MGFSAVGLEGLFASLLGGAASGAGALAPEAIGAGLGADAFAAGTAGDLAAAGGAGATADTLAAGAGGAAGDTLAAGGIPGLTAGADAGGLAGILPDITSANGLGVAGGDQLGASTASFADRFAGLGSGIPGSTPVSTVPISGGGIGASSLAGPVGDAGADTLSAIGPGAGPEPAGFDPNAGTPISSSGSGFGDFLSKLGTGAVNQVTKNPLGLALGAVPAAMALFGNNKVPQQGNLQGLTAAEQSLAQQQQQLSQTLTQPLQTGQLPPQAEQSVQNAINDAISTTKARYANLGLSGSTMEADAIANIQNQATSQRFAIAQQMAQTGEAAVGQSANALGLQDQVYTQLMNAQIAQDQGLQTALARFASAAAGAPQSVNLKLT